MARLIFVNRYFYPDHSATSQLVSDLAFELAAQGHDVQVLTGGQLYTDAGASLARQDVIRGVRVSRLRTSRFGRARLWGRLLDYLTFYMGATWRLLRMVGRDDVVIAKTDPPMVSVCAALVVTAKRGRLINWSQDLFPEVALALDVPGVRPVAPILRVFRNWSLRRATMNVVLGSRMAQRFRDAGIPAERIRIIHNWADGKVIRPVPHEDNPLRREWALESKFVVGYSGNMGQAHEFQTLLDVAERLNGDGRIAFLLIGDGAARRWIEAEAHRRGLGNIQLRPYQPAERLCWSLSVADIHWVSLRPELEGCIVPSKVYGIAAAGRPVLFVGAVDGEIARLVHQDRIGWTFAVGAVEEIVRRLAALISDRTVLDEAGSRARLAFDRRFSRELALQEWGNVLGVAVKPACQSLHAAPSVVATSKE